jgi:hypothetical protein
VEIKDIKIIKKRLYVNEPLGKRKIKLMAKIGMGRLVNGRGTHPGAGKGCMLDSLLGMLLVLQNMPLHPNHDINMA